MPLLTGGRRAARAGRKARSPRRKPARRGGRGGGSSDDDGDADTPPLAAPGAAGVMVQLHHRDARGRVVPSSRTAPMAAVSMDWLARVARTTVKAATQRGFLTLWRSGIASSACTHRLGHGAYGTVFRVCEPRAADGGRRGGGGGANTGKTDRGCDACIAVKFGADMAPDGRVIVGTGRGKTLQDLAKAPAKSVQGLTVGEVMATHAVTAAVLNTRASPHVVRFLGYTPWPQRHTGFLFLQYLPPAASSPRISNLEDLLGTAVLSMTDTAWRGLLFQLIYTLAALQASLPGFRHNDGHLGNWMLTDAAPFPDTAYTLQGPGGGGGGAAASTSWRVRAPRYWPTLIDFGMADWFGGPLPPPPPHDAKSAAFFRTVGIVHEPCAYFDVAALLYDLVDSMEILEQDGRKPRWDVVHFYMFATACIPPKYWKPPLAAHGRLTVAGQRAIVTDAAAVPPHRMLLHPYFAPLRASPDGAAQRYGFRAAQANTKPAR